MRRPSARLSSLAHLNNLSIRMSVRPRTLPDREFWTDIRRDLEAMCGEIRNGDDMELVLKALEARVQYAEYRSPLLSGEMAKPSGRKRGRKK
jgi:hypothetical protein